MVRYRLFNKLKDKKEFVSLINRNLNPQYSEERLAWKHFNNPFGNSKGVVAVENDQIIAGLFYMSYPLHSKDGKKIKAARPLDACTDKAYRGKGIFKGLIQFCGETLDKDYDMVFGNPNANSYPELLKLGWESIPNYLYRWGVISFYKSYTQAFSEVKSQNLIELLSWDEKLFINWRFKDPRYQRIALRIEDEIYLLIYRKKKIKGISTLIICFFFGDEKFLNLVIRYTCRKENTYFIYALERSHKNKISWFLQMKHHNAVIVQKTRNKAPNFIPDFSLADLEGIT